MENRNRRQKLNAHPPSRRPRKFICSANDFSLASGQGGGQKNEKFIESLLYLFLSQFNSKQQLSRAVAISKLIKLKHKALKLNFLVAISLYLTFKNTFPCEKELFEMLSTYFSINVRTLKSHLKDVSKTLQTKKCFPLQKY